MRTLITITGRNSKLFEENVTRALNIATMVARRGTLPDPYYLEEENRERCGEWWVLEGDTYNILGTVNSHKAFIREKGENTVTLEFQYRYDRKPEKGPTYAHTVPAIISLILPDDSVIISEDKEKKEKRKLLMYQVNFLFQIIHGEIKEKDAKSELDKATWQEFGKLSKDELYGKIELMTKEIHEIGI